MAHGRSLSGRNSHQPAAPYAMPPPVGAPIVVQKGPSFNFELMWLIIVCAACGVALLAAVAVFVHYRRAFKLRKALSTTSEHYLDASETRSTPRQRHDEELPLSIDTPPKPLSSPRQRYDEELPHYIDTPPKPLKRTEDTTPRL